MKEKVQPSHVGIASFLDASSAKIIILTLAITTFLFIFADSSHAVNPPCIYDTEWYYNSYPICYEPGRFSEIAGQPLDEVGALIGCLTKEQGYEVHCASQPWYIWKNLINPGVARYFYENYPEYGTIVFDSCGTYGLSASGATVPIYRSDDCPDLTHKSSSYEGYFGSLPPHEFPEFWHENTTKRDPTASGVANHLLTKGQKCERVFRNLETIHFYCMGLISPAWCYVNSPITNSRFNRWGLWGVLHNLRIGYANHSRNVLNEEIFCEEIMGSWESFEEKHPLAVEIYALDKERFYDIQTAVDNVGFNFENLYRTVFLFISVGQDPYEIHEEAVLEGNYKKNISENEHMTFMIIFKVPDFLANESRFKDAATTTREIILTDEQRSTQYTEAWDRRDDLFRAALNRNTGTRFFRGDPIYCPNMPECIVVPTKVEWILRKNPIGGVAPVYVAQETYRIIRNAVIDIINGNNDINDSMCHAPLIYEEAGEIGTNAHLENVARGQFIGEPVPWYHPDGFKTSIVTRGFNWEFSAANYEEYEENFEFWGELGLPVRAWIVAPYGIEQEHVLEAMQQRFFTLEQQQRMLEENYVVDSNEMGVYPEYFPFDGAGYGMFFDDECVDHKIYGFRDIKDPSDLCQIGRPVKLFDRDGDPYIIYIKECPWKEFGKGITESKNRLNIFGALVGWGIRKVQETIHQSGTFMHDYFASCERVEDMFLGKCGTSSTTASGSSPSPNWKPVTNSAGEPITLYVTTDKGTCPGTLVKFEE